MIKIGEACAVDSRNPEFTHPHIIILYEIAEEIIGGMQTERRSLGSGYQYLLIICRHRSLHQSRGDIVVRLDRLEHDAEEGIVGFGNTRFGNKRLKICHIWQIADLGKQGIGERDGKHLVGVVVIEIDDLHMGTKAGHLVGDGSLEAYNNAKGDKHHHDTYSYTRQGDTYRRAGGATALILGVVEPSRDPYCVRPRHIANRI